jgi:superfamily I DNA/RNA helicase
MFEKAKDLREWRVAELVAAKVKLEQDIRKGTFHNDALQRARKRLEEMQDELNRRRRAGLL